MKKLSLLSVLIITVFALAACGSAQGNANVSGSGEQVKIVHELDEVTLDKNPEKVVVFDYGILDSLDALGIDIVGLPKATLPDHLDRYKGDEYEDLGTLKEPNFEKIYELQPDVIFISARQLDLYEEFKAIAPTIYVPLYGEDYMNSMKSNLGILGQVFGKEDVVAEKVKDIEVAINDLNEKVSATGKNALFIMANEGSMSVYGPGSRFGMVYSDFGFKAADENIEVSTHGQKVSYEYILEKNPDYLIVLDRGAATNGELSAQSLMNNEIMEETSAYKNDNIIYVNAHLWYVATGGLNGTLEMVEEIDSAISR
jgi:iron complex transport system substrate-binding protein